MIVGDGIFVSPSDSLAVLASRSSRVPCLAGLAAVARSMPTSRALDRVARARGLPLFETPTGWKYFANLMDAYSPFLCGEESFGTGADHVREKDGLWALLAWLSVLDPGESVRDVLHAHWTTFGRDLYCRYDFEACDPAQAALVFDHLRAASRQGGDDDDALVVVTEFEYVDPIDHSVTKNQGIVVEFPASEERAVFRLSGTGSEGATIRLYLERYVAAPTQEDLEAAPAVVLADLAARAIALADLAALLGRTEPDLVT